MATPADKSGMEHVDNITAASSAPSVQGAPLEKYDTATTGDEIVQNLAHAGEEVGMTWRSILAAGVSLHFQSLADTRLMSRLPGYGLCLQRLCLYASDSARPVKFDQRRPRTVAQLYLDHHFVESWWRHLCHCWWSSV